MKKDIARIEKMLKNEKQHLQQLLDHENTPIEWIKLSEDMILHYEQRIEEYKNFAE